jgi:hypothetical protein
MTKAFCSVVVPVTVFLAFALGAGCGGGSSSSNDGGVDGGGDASTDTDVDTDADTDADAGFDEDDPGINLTVALGSIYMMNTPIELATGILWTTAREDFDGADAEEIPLDTCVVQTGETPVPECTDNTDCAPEQQCLPENDEGGNPIPGTESCVTPRDPQDLGPFTIDGFATGSIEMASNAGQSGAYTPDGAGDGTLATGTIAYDVTYTITGDGGGASGLGAYEGELYVAPKMEITSPPLVPMAMEGMYGIEASMSADLALEWTGTNPDGDITLTIAGGQSDGTSVVCRVADDGAFTIPADMMAQSGLGAAAFFNMLTIDRRGKGHAHGEGLTFAAIEALQTTLLNVIKVE